MSRYPSPFWLRVVFHDFYLPPSFLSPLFGAMSSCLARFFTLWGLMLWLGFSGVISFGALTFGVDMERSVGLGAIVFAGGIVLACCYGACLCFPWEEVQVRPDLQDFEFGVVAAGDLAMRAAGVPAELALGRAFEQLGI
jgi:hypothetical protein